VWARANPGHFGNLTSHAPGGATEFGLLAVGFFVWVHANPAQFGNLTSHATGGVSEVGLLTVGLSVWVRAYTVREPDFSCSRCCLGSLAPSSWLLCVGACEPRTVREPDFSCNRWRLESWAPSSWTLGPLGLLPRLA
jgi:hypothetical protein